MINTQYIPTLSVARYPELIDDFATGSLLAYSDAHQIACCRSLHSIGFGNISLNKIEKYLSSAQNWSDHLQTLITDSECRLFFPNRSISMQNISQLAHFHDCKRRTTATSMWQAFNLRESKQNFLLARQEHRELQTKLSIQSYWIDTAQLPLTEKTLDSLYLILKRQGADSQPESRRQAFQWLSQFLRSNTLLESQVACGNIKKLTILIEQVVEFTRCREYKRTLGAEFKGLDSNWVTIQSNLQFFSEVQNLLKTSGVDNNVLSQWAQFEPHFFSLCRKASIVRRRLHKLNGLVKRQYFTPTESTGYMALAQKSISRLHIWLTVLQCAEKNKTDHGDSYCNLTPQQLLEKLNAGQPIRK